MCHVQTLPQCLNDAVTHDKKIPMQKTNKNFKKLEDSHLNSFCSCSLSVPFCSELFQYTYVQCVYDRAESHKCLSLFSHCLAQYGSPSLGLLSYTEQSVWFYSFNNSSLNSHNFSFYVESYYVLNFWASTILLC